MNSYLSAITFFARLPRKTGSKLTSKLKGIFLISEDTDPIRRLFVEDVFQTKTSTFYGHSERAFIAYETSANEYAFDPFYCFTELIPDDTGTFSIVGTGFLNFSMPLIRYLTDDICLPSANGYKIFGRWKRTEGPIGKNWGFFSHAAFNFHSTAFDNVLRYQLIQKEKGKALLLMTVSDRFTNADLAAIRQGIRNKIGDVIEFEIRLVDQMVLTKRGKFQIIINEMRQCQ